MKTPTTRADAKRLEDAGQSAGAVGVRPRLILISLFHLVSLLCREAGATTEATDATCFDPQHLIASDFGSDSVIVQKTGGIVYSESGSYVPDSERKHLALLGDEDSGAVESVSSGEDDDSDVDYGN